MKTPDVDPLMGAPTLPDPHTPMTEEQILAGYVIPPAPLVGRIQLEEYNPAWPRLFAREATRIRAALGDAVVQLGANRSLETGACCLRMRGNVLLNAEQHADNWIVDVGRNSQPLVNKRTASSLR